MNELVKPVLSALALLAMTSCAPNENTRSTPAAADETPMTWDDFNALPVPIRGPDERIAYGNNPLQFSELWLPVVDGIPADGLPTVLMIHGGCWQTDIAERDIMDRIAGDLRDNHAIAVWNIEYRGVDREGGGYPGTYQDVIAAVDSLAENADRYNLNVSNLVVIGHSAGGHLALWLAARQTMLPTPVFGEPSAVTIRTAISQGGLPDLERGSQRENHPCGAEAPRLMMGGEPGRTSPQRMPASSAHEILVNAERDPIAPPSYAEDYRSAQLARDKTDVELVVIPREGHAELIAPGTASWERQVELINTALGRTRP